jgi:hypothetical protein
MAETKVDRKARILEALASGRPAWYAELREIARSYAPIQELVEEGRLVRMGWTG